MVAVLRAVKPLVAPPPKPARLSTVSDSSTPKLKRSLGLSMLAWYGIGTIVGGGFYALVGKVVGEAGLFAPISYVIAAVIATLTALSYAELSSRYPVSEGAARYVGEGLGQRWLSTVTGWLVVATGVVSAATLARAFSGFSLAFTVIPESWIILAVVIGLTVVAAAGIAEAAVLVGLITALEVGGLIWILAVSGDALTGLSSRLPEFVPPASAAAWSGILSGSFLCFYSFIGFEDMVTLAEEVRRPERNLPRGIFLALGATTLLYVLVTFAVVLNVPLNELVASAAPLSLAMEQPSHRAVLTVIAMLAGVNGAMVQIVMASRVMYGMAGRGQGPRRFARVHPKTHTPLEATLACAVVVLVLALWLPLTQLAETTSTALLAVFALVNLSLWRIKGREETPEHALDIPRFVPLLGFAACTAFLVYRTFS